MPLPVWQGRQTLQMPTARPTAAIAQASLAAGNIVKQAQADEELALKAQQTASLAEHRGALLAQGDRRQDFVEGEQGRIIAEEERQLGLATERGIFANQAADSVGFSGAEAFKGLEAEAARMADPRFANLSADEMNKSVEDFTMAAGHNLTSPADFQNRFRAALTKSGKFTEAQIQTRVANRMTELYPQIDPKLLAAQMVKPSMANTGNNVTINGDGSVGRGGKQSNKLIQGQGDLNDRNAMIQEFMTLNDITDNTKGTLGRFFDIGDRSVVGSDIGQLLAKTGDQVSDRAVLKAVQVHMKDSGETKRSFNMRNPTKKQLDSLIADAKAIQNQEQQTFERTSGTTGTPEENAANGGGVNSLQNSLAAAGLHNARIMAQSGRRGFTAEQLNDKFLDTLGPKPDETAPDAPLLTGDTGGVDEAAEAALQLQIDSAQESNIPPVASAKQDALLTTTATKRIDELRRIFGKTSTLTNDQRLPYKREHNRLKKLLRDLEQKETTGSGQTKGKNAAKAKSMNEEARATLIKLFPDEANPQNASTGLSKLFQNSQQTRQTAGRNDPLAFDLLDTGI